MKRLLLDTHIWLWYIGGSKDLPGALREVIDASLGLLWLSPISLWEVGILARKRRIRISAPFQDWVPEALDQVPVRETPLDFEIARRVQTIALPHGDPADHFLAATALVYGLTMVTLDQPWSKPSGFLH